MATKCEVCGSEKIIPNVRVVDQGQYSDGQLKLVVFGEPDALIFKDKLYGKVAAHVCGECGHIELRVSNPQEMYRKYRASLE
jgi:hypothetical protein